jgi:hypothetical protein
MRITPQQQHAATPGQEQPVRAVARIRQRGRAELPAAPGVDGAQRGAGAGADRDLHVRWRGTAVEAKCRRRGSRRPAARGSIVGAAATAAACHHRGQAQQLDNLVHLNHCFR